MNNRDLLVRELMKDRDTMLILSKKYALMAKATEGKADPRLTTVYAQISVHLKAASDCIKKE